MFCFLQANCYEMIVYWFEFVESYNMLYVIVIIICYILLILKYNISSCVVWMYAWNIYVLCIVYTEIGSYNLY